MHTMLEKDVQLVTTAPFFDPTALATLVVLAVNPAYSPGGTPRPTGQPAIWPGRFVPIDEEPTWEDAAWQ